MMVTVQFINIDTDDIVFEDEMSEEIFKEVFKTDAHCSHVSMYGYHDWQKDRTIIVEQTIEKPLVSQCKGNIPDFESGDQQFDPARDCMDRIISADEVTRIVRTTFWDYMRDEAHKRFMTGVDVGYTIPKTKIIAEVTIESPMVQRQHSWF